MKHKLARLLSLTLVSATIFGLLAPAALADTTIGTTITVRDATSANNDTIQVIGLNGGAATFTGSVTSVDLTATRTWTLPDAGGTFTLLGNASTGTGSIVLATSPTLVTPVLGVATATTLSVSGALAANGGITFDAATDTVGAHTLSGTLDLATNSITNGGTITATSFVGALTGNASTATTAGTVTTAAQPAITSVGTLTALQVDNINIDLNTISSTAGTDLLITPLAGQQIVLDGAIVIDAGVVTGATSITSTSFVGALTGNASTATTASTVTTNANLTGPITSVGNATAVAAQTGTGSTFVMNTSPTLVTPNIGVATATSVNGLSLTANADGFSVAGGTTSRALTVTGGAITLTGQVGGSAITLPSSGTLLTSTSTLANLASSTSLQLATLLSDETGSGAAVFATSPTLVTPALGVATATSLNSSGVVTAGTAASGLVLGTGVNATTFSSGATSARAITFPDLAGTVALTANNLSAFAATTSAQLAGVISDETGSGALVFATSPTLVTPALGVATGTSLALGGGTALTTTNQTGTGSLVLATSPTITTLTVSSGGITVTGNSTITGTLGGLTGLTVASGGAAITGASSINGNLTLGPATSHLISTQTTAPTATQSAGVATITAGSTDTAGTVTSDATAHTTVGITFNATYTTVPFCVAVPANTAAGVVSGSAAGVFVTTTATTMNINMSSDTTVTAWTYHCIGQ